MVPRRSRLLVLLLGSLFVLPAGSATAAEDIDPYVVCFGGECDIGDGVTREELELTAGNDLDLLFVEDGDPPGDVVCLEGVKGCTVRGEDVSIADIKLLHDGRVIHGLIDADPRGDWKVVNLRSKMLCKPKGSRAVTIKVKKASDRGTITREESGLIAQSRRSGEASFRLVRMSPGVYASIQPFAEAGIKGDMTSYYGMLSESEIAGTSIIRTTVKRDGMKIACKMDRNFDMTRVGPAPEPDGVIDPSDPDGTIDPSDSDSDLLPDDIDSGIRDEASREGPAMAFDEDEVEPIGGDGPAMVFDEDEVEDGAE
jgi:hypothetical protein